MASKVEISGSTEQLADSLHDAGHDILIEASAGSGTSQLLQALRNLGSRQEIIELRDGLNESATGMLVARLTERGRSPVIVACRRAPESVWSALKHHVALRETDLWYTTHDVAHVLGREVVSETVADVARFTSGWPWAVNALAALGADLDAAGLDAIADQPARIGIDGDCLLYTSPSPRDLSTSRMPSSA